MTKEGDVAPQIFLCLRAVTDNVSPLLLLDLEMAIAYWNIVLKGNVKFLDLWCSFLRVMLHSISGWKYPEGEKINS